MYFWGYICLGWNNFDSWKMTLRNTHTTVLKNDMRVVHVIFCCTSKRYKALITFQFKFHFNVQFGKFTHSLLIHLLGTCLFHHQAEEHCRTLLIWRFWYFAIYSASHTLFPRSQSQSSARHRCMYTSTWYQGLFELDNINCNNSAQCQYKMYGYIWKIYTHWRSINAFLYHVWYHIMYFTS